MTHRMLFVGGCHVAGYHIAPAQAFPVILSRQVGSNLVGQVPHVAFAHLPAHLATIAALAPTQVVFQLGNYECTASGRLLLQRLLPAVATKLNKPVGAVPAGAVPAGAIPAGAVPAGAVPAGAVPAGAVPAGAVQYLRAAGAGLLNAALWCGAPRYRRSLRALNAYMRQHPTTTFVFLSPFPCRPAADNAMRRFGGWLLRRRLARLPNCHWVDTHALLPADARLFADPWHLNESGHQLVASGLACCLAAAAAAGPC